MKDFLVDYAPTIFGVLAGLLSGFLSTAFFRWRDRRGKLKIFFRPVEDDRFFTINDYSNKHYACLPVRLEFFNTSYSSKIVGNFQLYFVNVKTKNTIPAEQVRMSDSQEKIATQQDISRYGEYTYSFSLPPTTMREVLLQFDIYFPEPLKSGDKYEIYFSYMTEKNKACRGLFGAMRYVNREAHFAFSRQYHELHIFSQKPVIGTLINKRFLQHFRKKDEILWEEAEKEFIALFSN